MPQIRAVSWFIARKTPINATMTALGFRSSIGRTTTRSMPAPTAKPRTRASRIDRKTGNPVSVNVDTKKAPIVPISPWAKFS